MFEIHIWLQIWSKLTIRKDTWVLLGRLHVCNVWLVQHTRPSPPLGAYPTGKPLHFRGVNNWRWRRSSILDICLARACSHVYMCVYMCMRVCTHAHTIYWNYIDGRYIDQCTYGWILWDAIWLKSHSFWHKIHLFSYIAMIYKYMKRVNFESNSAP